MKVIGHYFPKPVSVHSKQGERLLKIMIRPKGNIGTTIER